MFRMFKRNPSFSVAVGGIAVAAAVGCSTTPSGGSNNNIIVAGQDAISNTGGTDPTGGFTLNKYPFIVVTNSDAGKVLTPGGQVNIDTGSVKTGDTSHTVLAVSNSGSANLGINSIKLAYTAPSPDEAAGGNSLTCSTDDGTGNQVACEGFKFPGVGFGAGAAPVKFQINFKKYNDTLARSAILTISNTDSHNKQDSYKLYILTSAGSARIQLQPETVDMGFVQVGANKNGNSDLLSVGSSALNISDVDASALDPTMFTYSFVDENLKNIVPPFTIEPGSKVRAQIVYTGKDDKPHLVDLVLKTNDGSQTADGGSGFKKLHIKVNSSGPCLLIDPNHVVFGATNVGQTNTKVVKLSSCGDQPVCISSATFDKPPGQGPFDLDWSTSGGPVPSDAKPVCIAVNGSVSVAAKYTPSSLSPVDPATKQPTPDKATVTVKSDSGNGVSKVALEGVGASGDCPTAVISISEGDTVTPQTMLHLDGTKSQASGNSQIKTYAWELVAAPKGNVAGFFPNKSASKVQFQPNIAGAYKFHLTVTDTAGKVSCFPAEQVVNVLPDQALHVELTWNTPGDADQTDEGPYAGSDMDLHVANDFASMPDFDKDSKPDPWFSDAYDCYWYTCSTSAGKTLEWGSYDPNIDDNPHLDRDDTDGGGPENMNLAVPEDQMTYHVGVHYFKDHGFGPSTPTVNIFVYGNLVFTKTTPNSMVMQDMWFTADVHWLSKVDVAGVPPPGCNPAATKCAPFITPKYPSPGL